MHRQAEEDLFFIKKAIKLAEKGRGWVAPNPMVGVLIVKDGNIVGQGFHQKYGTPHAEAIALMDAYGVTEGATLYTTMEPCVHKGKTPPCVEKIIKANIKRVVIGAIDPNPLVNGKGIEQLKKNKIEVIVGIGEELVKKQNEAYFKHTLTNLPFVVIKAAITLNGKLALTSGESKWITNEKTKIFVHKLRAESQGVMVGINTILKDNPLLTTRLVEGKNPIKIVLDSNLRIPENANLLKEGKVIIFTSEKRDHLKRKLPYENVEIVPVPLENGLLSLKAVLKELGRRQITQVLVEGGSKVISNFLSNKLADKIVLCINPSIIGKGIAIADRIEIKSLNERIKLRNVVVDRLGEDILVEGYPVYRDY